ncbi:MAG: hypothetical protein AAF617_13865 [Bacteroidota bacterium]
MKKQQIKSSLKLTKSVISNFNSRHLKGGTIGLESVDRLYCLTEDCVTQDCITVAFSNCYLCPNTTC